jgi:hypothetical protein
MSEEKENQGANKSVKELKHHITVSKEEPFYGESGANSPNNSVKEDK